MVKTRFIFFFFFFSHNDDVRVRVEKALVSMVKLFISIHISVIAWNGSKKQKCLDELSLSLAWNIGAQEKRSTNQVKRRKKTTNFELEPSMRSIENSFGNFSLNVVSNARYNNMLTAIYDFTIFH